MIMYHSIESGQLREESRRRIIYEYEKGNATYFSQHIDELDAWTRGEVFEEVLLMASEREDIEFLKQYFCEAGYIHGLQDQIIIKAYKSGDIEFAQQHFDEIGLAGGWPLQRQIMMTSYERGDIEFVEEYINRVHFEIRGEILKTAYEKEDMTFVERHLSHTDSHTRLELAIAERKKGKNELVRKLLMVENSKKEQQGKKTVSCSGKMLNEALSQGKIDKDFIIVLIRLGSGLDYVAYNNVDGSTPEYIPTLYKALKLEDATVRKEIITEMLKSGVSIDSKYVARTYHWDKSVEKTEIHCLDANNGELVQIMSELGMEVPQEKQNITAPKRGEKQPKEQKQDNRVLVCDFLTHEVGLNEEEIKKLETTYRGWGRDLYSLSTERLGMQKAILDSVGGTKRAFTTDAKVLNNDPQVLYSRLMFYRESGITVMPDRLYTTLGISKKGFAKNFGSRVLEKGNMEDSDYEYKLKQELLKRYPMPETRDELKRTLEELNKEEIGG